MPISNTNRAVRGLARVIRSFRSRDILCLSAFDLIDESLQSGEVPENTSH